MLFRASGPSHEKPGSDLLWHGLRPHYHRRRTFSLPSSEWDRVVPVRYCRQAKPVKIFASTLVAFANAISESQPDVISSMHRPQRQQTNALRLYGQVSRAISTGQLSALLRVHTRPINHVVFVGPLGESSSQGDLVLGGASRLDAFSGYPVRT